MTTYVLRIGLLALTNLAVVLLLGIILRVTGLDLLMGSVGIHRWVCWCFPDSSASPEPSSRWC